MIHENIKIQMEERYTQISKDINDETIPIEKRIDDLGIIIDLSLDLHKTEGLDLAINIGEQFGVKKTYSESKKAVLFFYLANAYAFLRSLTTPTKHIWNDKNFKKEISSLKRALYSNGFQSLPKEIQCRILVNLGNAFSKCGRYIESLECYDQALEKDPNHSMGRGNKGISLYHYATILNDSGHRDNFAREAYFNLKQSLDKPDDPYALQQFQKRITYLESFYPPKFLKDKLSFNEYSLGETDEERKYRMWVLANKLFLHPINDLGAYSAVARDFLSVPCIVADINDPPVYQGFFNQLKQEFVSARFFYYDSITSKGTHFSDEETCLLDTLDYPEYSIQVEKLKISYRMLYSLFDKIAYFINDYFQLEEIEHNIAFKTIWFKDFRQKTRGVPFDQLEVRQELIQNKNMALTALFWVSIDLYDKDASYKEYLEPEAQQLSDIRNHLEHKYLKIHDTLWEGKPSDVSILSHLYFDTLAYSIYRSDFEKKTHKLLKIVRAALMYLVFAITIEEKRREQMRDPNLFIPGIGLPQFRE